MALRLAAIDSDFFQKTTDFDKNGALFAQMMRDLGYRPVMHEYVAKEELWGKYIPLVERLGIEIVTYDDFLGEDSREREQYEMMFQDLYKIFTGRNFPASEDVYDYHRKGESLGEIRTALMAVWKNIDMFLSDDGAAKTNIRAHLYSSRHKIEVYSIYDVLLTIGRTPLRQLKWQDVKGFARRMSDNRSNLHYYDDIQKVWVSIPKE